MRRPRVARQPREGAVARAGAEACVPAASRIEHSTAAPNLERADPSETFRACSEGPATEAEILLGTAMWLAGTRDWLADEIDLAAPPAAERPTTITLSLADVETLRHGLDRAVALLDHLTVDPAQIRACSGPMQSTAGRTLQ